MARTVKPACGRTQRGNMLVLVTAITVGIVLALVIFCYNYVRLFATQGQTKNAIDAAALTAAGELGKIVVNTKEYGYVSLSDDAPTGLGTIASDQYYLPVRSINSLIGTCRLENQLAIAMKDQTLSYLAQYDLAQAQSAISQLETALNAALQPNGQGQDIYGKAVTPYQDAENAYKANDTRPGQQYVSGSLKLTLGALSKPIPTNIQVPQPTTLGGLHSSQSQGGFYLSDTPVPFGNGAGNYGSQNVVIAPVAQSLRLVDVKTFVTQISDIPASKQMLAAVRSDADEKVVDSQNPNGVTMQVSSCAVPSNVYDPKPAPGALSISFPDGPIPEFTTPMSILNDNSLNGLKVDLQTAAGGDYPTDAGSKMNPGSWMLTQQPSTVTNVARACIYDWIRRAGTKANIQSIITTLDTPFQPAKPATKDWITLLTEGSNSPVDITTTLPGPVIPVGVMHVYKFNSDGTVKYSTKAMTPYPYSVASEAQMYGEALNAFKSQIADVKFINLTLPQVKGNKKVQGDVTLKNIYDVYFRDEVRQPGKLSGGKHGGEPLDNSQVSYAPKPHQNSDIAFWNAPLHGSAADMGGGGLGADGDDDPPPPTGKGGGSPPLLTSQSDFAETMVPAPTYVTFPTGPNGGQMRKTYTTNGEAVDIRFRRQVKIAGKLSQYLSIQDVGYLGVEF